MMLFLTHYWLQDVNAIFEVCTLAWMKLPFLWEATLLFM